MRLATAVYVLVNDGGRKNQSLITRLGIRRQLSFIASGTEITGNNYLMDQPLVAVRLNGDRTCSFEPLLGNYPERIRRLSCENWWARDQIYSYVNATMTRKRLVFALRNQEGGSHFDQLDDESYIKFAKESVWSFLPVGGETQKMYGIEHATMRQVAWELLETLKSV